MSGGIFSWDGIFAINHSPLFQNLSSFRLTCTLIRVAIPKAKGIEPLPVSVTTPALNRFAFSATGILVRIYPGCVVVANPL